MKTATQKPQKQLLQQGDRIRGTSPQGHQHAGTFEGYSTKDLILCKEGERTIALNPATVDRDAEPAGNGKDPTRLQPALFPLPELPINPLETLGIEIAALYADAEQAETTMLNAGKAALSLYLELGEKLLAAKEQVSHGEWLPWLKMRKVQERKAQRAIALFKGRPTLEALSVTLSDLTLTEALALVSSKKALKTATPDEPQTENAPIPANLASAPTEAPDQVVEDVAPKTEALEGENGASAVDPYEYIDIPQQDAWFDPGNGMAAGRAIARNGKGMVRINWGRGKQSDVPSDRVSWSEPAMTAVTAEIEAGLAAIGLDVCTPSITPEEFNREMWGTENPTLQTVQANGLAEHRPTGSQWLPEEVERTARIQLQGLLKHLSPSELVKSAIVHSGASVVDAVRVAVEMATKAEFEAICDLLIEEGN